MTSFFSALPSENVTRQKILSIFDFQLLLNGSASIRDSLVGIVEYYWVYLLRDFKRPKPHHLRGEMMGPRQPSLVLYTSIERALLKHGDSKKQCVVDFSILLSTSSISFPAIRWQR